MQHRSAANKMLDLNVIIRDVRSFAGRHVLPVGPITLVVGENSSGKSTFLGVLSAILDGASYPLHLNLNRTPYDFGGFDNILTSVRKGGERPSTFALGFTARADVFGRVQAIGTYSGSRGQVMLSEFLLESSKGVVRLTKDQKNLKVNLLIRADEKHKEDLEVEFEHDDVIPAVDVPSLVLMGALRQKSELARALSAEGHRRLFDMFSGLFFVQQETGYSLAPIRTKPRRTYDQVNELFTPEGDHIPLLLSRIFGDEDRRELRNSLRSALSKFGKESGLFNTVGVRRLGLGASDPFQVRVSMTGRASNLTDVGYGVSQALPVVVESVVGSDERILLLQQPEVHLHPRAQAALGTFFADLVASQRKQFIIETHSDYLIDRIRQEVANGRLRPEAVSVLFFDRSRGATKVHPMKLDKLGNLINAPKQYRSFFLAEQSRLLLRGK